MPDPTPIKPWPGNPDLATLYQPAAVERVVDITRDQWTVTLAIEPRTVLAALRETHNVTARAEQ